MKVLYFKLILIWSFCVSMSSLLQKKLVFLRFFYLWSSSLTTIKLKGTILTYRSGSFLYMAPEVHLKYPVDVTCDMWSAGVVLYSMMFRRSIFGLSETSRALHISFLKRRATPNVSFPSLLVPLFYIFVQVCSQNIMS